MRSRTLGSFLIAASLIVASCGVPTDETAQSLDPSQLPESLRPDFTTTTTTTTIAAPTTAPVTVYLLWTPPDTERRLVVDVPRDLPRNPTIDQVLGAIFEKGVTAPEEELTYVNALFELRLLSASVTDGIATVDVVPLDPEGEPTDEVFTGDLIGAAAQMVFTATEDESITGVVILFDGDPVSIPTNKGDADPGAVLTRALYERFDPSIPEVIPETTTTGAPTETVPEG